MSLSWTFDVVHQLRRMVNANANAQSLSRKHCRRLRSPNQAEPMTRQRHSRSPWRGHGSPPNWGERHPRDNTCFFKHNKPEVFHSSAGPCGRVCVVCLGRHEHSFAKCEDAILWDSSANAAQKSKQGQLVAVNRLPLCFDWQILRGCAAVSHPDWHRCLGCGRPDHGAQGCP